MWKLPDIEKMSFDQKCRVCCWRIPEMPPGATDGRLRGDVTLAAE